MTPERDKSADIPVMQGKPGRLAPDESAQITRRITVMAVTVGLILALGKLWIWDQTHSVGILSSLVHSALDLFGALSTFVAVRYAARKPNDAYRFGHGKAESFSAVFQVCLIVFAAFHLLEEAIERFINPQTLHEPGFAIFAMSLFVMLTLWLLIAQSWAIQATGSVAIKGDRAHYLADMLTNIVVIMGVAISSFTSFIRADALVGIAIAFWLFWTAFKIGRLAWAQLMDRELPDEDRIYIRELVMQDEHIKAVKNLRTRASGPHIHIQMRLDLDDTLSLNTAHDVVLAAEHRLMAVYKAADILIYPHPDGCDHSHGNIRFRS